MNTKVLPQPIVKSKSPLGSRSSPTRRSPAQISALVPMAQLLQELGFEPNERTHRAPCILHGGQNLTAFSWTEDGRWYCFHCGIGGDRIELVKRVKRCEFKEALAFLAHLSGVQVSQHRPHSREMAENHRKHERVEYGAEKLRLLEAHLTAQYREEIHDLERIKRLAIGILKAKHQREECDGEVEWAWRALGLVYEHSPPVLAGYTILSFANAKERARFALHPEQAEEIIDQTIHRGYVLDDQGRVCEVLQ